MITFFFAKGLDADAKAFLTAIGVSGGTIEYAIDKMVTDLKDAALWSKIYALYPFVGGTASTCKYNLKDPRDLDAANRLTFYNNPTIDADGVSWNGTTQYADTHYLPSSTVNDKHLGYYALSGTSSGWDIGMRGPASFAFFMALRGGQSTMFAYVGTTMSNGETFAKGSTSGLGHFIAAHTGTTARAHRNGVALTGSGGPMPSASYSNGTSSVFIGANNNAGTPSLFTANKVGLAHIGDTLSNTEAITMSGIINQFMTTMGKNTY